MDPCSPSTIAVHAEMAPADDAEHAQLCTGSALSSCLLLTEEDDAELSLRWPRALRCAVLTSDCIAPAILLLLIGLTLTGFLALNLSSTSNSPSTSQPLPPYIPSSGICVLARVDDVHSSLISAFISVLALNQRPPRIFFVATARDSDVDELRAIVQQTNQLHQLALSSVLSVTWAAAKRLYSDLDEVESFGYVHTDLAMATLTEEHPECRYLSITDTDYIHSPHLLDRVELLTALGYELIGWSFVSHHPRLQRTEVGTGAWDALTCGWVRADFVPSEIDLSASLFQLSLWKQLHLSFTQLGGQFGFAEADSRLIRQVIAANVSRILMTGTCLVHR